MFPEVSETAFFQEWYVKPGQACASFTPCLQAGSSITHDRPWLARSKVSGRGFVCDWRKMSQFVLWDGDKTRELATNEDRINSVSLKYPTLTAEW